MTGCSLRHRFWQGIITEALSCVYLTANGDKQLWQQWWWKWPDGSRARQSISRYVGEIIPIYSSPKGDNSYMTTCTYILNRQEMTTHVYFVHIYIDVTIYPCHVNFSYFISLCIQLLYKMWLFVLSILFWTWHYFRVS